jgi:hypothetical protein
VQPVDHAVLDGQPAGHQAAPVALAVEHEDHAVVLVDADVGGQHLHLGQLVPAHALLAAVGQAPLHPVGVGRQLGGRRRGQPPGPFVAPSRESCGHQGGGQPEDQDGGHVTS